MNYLYSLVLFFLPHFLFPQISNFFKVYNSVIGTSAISINTLTAKTYSFTQPIYHIVTDTATDNMYISTRQKDASGKNYTNRGFHLILKQNDSACCMLQDSKLDLAIAGEYLILSNDKRSGRYNRDFGYEQFEFPSKIIYPVLKNNSGLTYNPAFKLNGSPALSSISLKDGAILWSAPIPDQYDWNATAFLNDSVLLIAAGGLHAVNINKGLVWSYPLTTTQKGNKPYTYSAFNSSAIEKLYSGISTSSEEGQVTQIASNILITDSAIYFASKDKLLALNKNGKIIWESILPSSAMSNCFLRQNKENIFLINLGVARYKENLVLCGTPFVSAYNKRSGVVILDNKQDVPGILSDIGSTKNSILLAGNNNKVIEVTEDIKVKCLVDLPIEKFGRFLEFIDGDEYFVEKEGYYLSLNFINDNVVYFKTDHGKVFGMSNNNIEYEYHFTELYWINKKIGSKKLISQKNRSLLISDNFELLQTFNTGENAIFHNNKIYFAEGRLLNIIDVNAMK